jgi:hypothetical protein
MTLYYYEEMTMREIGLALGVVESRVSQVHASAVVHLRAALKDLAARGAFERPRSGALRRAQRFTPRQSHAGGRRDGRPEAGRKTAEGEGSFSRRDDGKDAQAGRDRRPLRGRAQLGAGGARTEVRARVVPYNFSSAGQISTEQLRAISMLNDLFARNLTHNLAAWLRTRFQVNLVSAEQIQFNEFLLRIPEISYVASVRLEPLGALSVLQLDLALAPPIIDLLLGGEGKDGPARADRHRGVDSGPAWSRSSAAS